MNAQKNATSVSLLHAVKPLHDAGWAIHWLMSREKRPLKGGWTTGPRATWEMLQKEFRPDLNVGVRLGEVSHLATGFLACLDCDVKSDDPAHRAEMENRLAELYPSMLSSTPTVTSGRGLGSRHIYGVTTEPMRQRVLAQSGETVRVKMPSVKPSKAEQQVLSASDLRAGWRLRPAWEITLMSEGRQMVIPPSVHPDSGKRYVWDTPFTSSENLPCLNAGELPAVSRTAAGPGRAGVALREFKWNPVEVDLEFDSRCDTSLRALAEDADGFDDHSKALWKACVRLQASGFSEDEILTILTNPHTVLGSCAYRHIQRPALESNRVRAAYWVKRYTFDAVMEKASARAHFDAVVGEEEEPKLPNEEAAAQEAELLQSGDWRMDLERGGPNGEGKPKNTLQNILLVLENAVGRNLFRKNDFTLRELYGLDAPWGARAGSEVSDQDLINIKVWLAAHYRFEPSTQLINEAAAHIADQNHFHPVREYLSALPPWDGEPRAGSWLKRLLSAKAPEPYLSAISRKVLVAMVARVMEPGVKFDHVLILENVAQGVGKSTTIRRLASDAWFSDAHIEIKDKDAVLAMNGVWAIELGELSSLKKSDVDQLKEFISRTTDRIRVPYGHRTEAFPRQCVFIGTTNSSEYFRDPTGNRRFWPVEVGECDFEGVARERDQLFAEALMLYELGERLYLDEREAQAGAQSEQEARMVHDALQDQLAEYFEAVAEQAPGERRFNPECFTMAELFGDFGPMNGQRMDGTAQHRVAASLRKLGFKSQSLRRNGRVVRRWAKV